MYDSMEESSIPQVTKHHLATEWQQEGSEYHFSYYSDGYIKDCNDSENGRKLVDLQVIQGYVMDLWILKAVPGWQNIMYCTCFDYTCLLPRDGQHLN